jgi:hypothetical protein
MYDCLVRRVDNPAKLQLWLADRIDIAPDGVTYTVAIKPGAQDHKSSATGRWVNRLVTMLPIATSPA